MPPAGTDTCGNPVAGQWSVSPVNIGHEIAFFKLGDRDTGDCNSPARPLRHVPVKYANDASSVELMRLIAGGAWLAPRVKGTRSVGQCIPEEVTRYADARPIRRAARCKGGYRGNVAVAINGHFR